MARALGIDLRLRVVKAIDGGLSTREAARRFCVGIATAGAWHRLWRATGDVRPRRQGHPGHSKLDPHEAFILALIEETKDVTLKEIAERLRAEREVHAWPSTIWQFLDRRGITFKKRPLTRPNRTAPMCWQAAEPGSNASSISIRHG